jgi:hypothetical protein
MKGIFSNIEFYNELETDLPTSSAAQRKAWASVIINNDLDIKNLSMLLHCNKKIALRFSWLLSEVGALNPDKLLAALPYLLNQSDQIDHFNFIESFATYWLISGVPLENESKAIDLLFQWVLSSQINVTTKSRSLKVLINITEKYPELKNELSICLHDQIDKHSKGFEKKAIKVLTELNL